MEEIICDLCGAKHQKLVYKSVPGDKNIKERSYFVTEAEHILPERIVRCLRCGLVFVGSAKDSQKILSHYREMVDEKYVGEEKGRRHTARVVLRKLSKFRSDGNRLLDVGCCAGFFLDEAKKAGWDVQGIELSKWAVQFAKEKFGLKVSNTSLDKAYFPRSYFDVIVLEDTIEHFLRPKEALIKIRQILKPTGIVYINTPDIDSWASRLLRARWWGINRFHLFYFSKKTLNRLLEASGFKSVKWSLYPRIFTLKYWLYRLEHYNRALFGFVNFFCQLMNLENKSVRINLADQIEVFAKKRRALEYLDELEEKIEGNVLRKTKTIAVLPAYNAAKTLRITYEHIPKDVVDEVILVDDLSSDNTVEIAKKLGMKVFVHEKNKGYGANQKTCYNKALELGADIVVMVHPDYQYDPRMIPELINPIRNAHADVVFGSRMLKGGALIGGMPLWKHNINIILSALANIILKTYLSEYHSGFRAYSARFLRTVPFNSNSNSFVFDFEIIVQAICHYCKIEEVPIRTRYFDEASSITFLASIVYGFGILKTLVKFVLHNNNIIRFKQFE